MKRQQLFVLAFVAALALEAALWWLAGYDFKSRGAMVGYFALISLVVAVCAGFFFSNEF